MVKRTGQIVDVPVGLGLLGCVVDTRRNPIDGKRLINASEPRRASLKAPGILSRRSINQPVMAGIKPINAMVPIGCDCELIVRLERPPSLSTPFS